MAFPHAARGEAGIVATVDGVIRWRGRRFVVEASGLRLKTLDRLVLGASPGPYRIYYLPKSRVAAAAEWSGEPLPYEEWYRRHPAFGWLSLPFNREGRRSPLQPGRWSMWPLAIPTILLLITCVAPFFVHGPNDLYVYLSQFVIFAFFFFAYSDFRRFTDLRPGKVASVEGVVERSAQQQQNGVWRYTITIDGQRFTAFKQQYDAFVESYRYRLYYTICGRKLLNAEPIGEIPALSDVAEV